VANNIQPYEASMRSVEPLCCPQSIALIAMVRQTVKWIGAMIALVKGKMDAVILTGGMANSKYLTNTLCTHISPLDEVRLYQGEFEMEALAEGVLRVLKKSEASLKY